MRLAYQIYHLVRADFLERVRRFSFLVLLDWRCLPGTCLYHRSVHRTLHL